jgi:hypothetical protein
MTESHDEEPVRTGVGEIDAVLEELDALDPDEVSAHVPVFERAHETLRRGLDTAAGSGVSGSDAGSDRG